MARRNPLFLLILNQLHFDKFSKIGNLNRYKSKNLTKEVFPAHRNDKQIGAIFYAAPRGDTSDIQMLVVLDMNGTIRKVKVFNHNETRAYPEVLNSYERHFEGITLADKMTLIIGTQSDKRGVVEAMTGATNTSKPIAIAVSEARKLFAEI